ncbi:MAG: hypothetical protein JF597_19075 [Streptomyces sp.]|uniref:DUF7019 family protein n=1 Tax=Streptomyces sp. TaxID=1931 RepID=UPI0025E42C19|nr:SAVMC3_10250 family protein [Streptomyces sp.]MBW8795613.1 hypothetical protein [Streptomyces sp.]
MTVRYYLYISDAKVDMLLSQIDPAFGRRSTTEAGLSVKLFSIKRSVEAPAPDRAAKLERVLRHLEESGQTGSVDEPGPYFRGTLPMQWGSLPGGNGGPLVYFGGRTDRTVLGLGGAGSHVIGASAPQAQEFAPSSVPTLLTGLATAFAADGVEIPAEQPSLAWVHTAGRLLRGPRQPVEFVARRLLAGPSPYPELDPRPDMRLLLGSPLYVALAD